MPKVELRLSRLFFYIIIVQIHIVSQCSCQKLNLGLPDYKAEGGLRRKRRKVEYILNRQVHGNRHCKLLRLLRNQWKSRKIHGQILERIFQGTEV